MLAGVGSWIEFARYQTLMELKMQDPTIVSQAQNWQELCKMTKNNQKLKDEINRIVETLFGLKASQWFTVSVQFYKNCRNPGLHKRPSKSEALELLDSLPQPFDSSKDVFE